jgi:Spy/CpxP family protein refolding chaperone
MNRKNGFGACALALTLCTIFALSSWGQGRGPQGNTGAPPDAPLGFLKQALDKAGAAPLSSDQETALKSLIADFRNANRPAATDSAEKAARDDYDSAVLAHNIGGAKAAAYTLAALQSARQQTILAAEAAFDIQVLLVLQPDQIAALQNSLGNQQVMRILASLIGPAGRPGPGRGMMGGAPMGRAPMGGAPMGARPPAR